MMVEVQNLRENKSMRFSLPPDQAVVAAYEYGRGNRNTWTNPKPEDHPEFTEGTQTVACGDWVAVKM